MKYFHELQIDEPTVPKEVFESLCGQKPECRKPNGFRYKVSSDNATGDEFIQNTVALLKRLGVPWGTMSNSTRYGHSVTRWFDKADFETAELLILQYQRKVKSPEGPARDENGRLIVLANDVKPNLKFGSTYPDNQIIVSDATRKILEGGGLVGLQFHPVTLKGKSSVALQELPWELDSNITLPKIANTHQLIHHGPTPFQGDYSKLVLLDDAPFCKGELHYRRKDLEALGPFDVANPLEKFLTSHPLVISQRFYQHCLKNKIPLEVEPVRIDPD